MAETGMVMRRGNYFRFGSVFIKKKLSNQKNNLKKITETGSNRPVSVRFGFFYKNLFKPVGSVFSVLLGFCFGSVFSVWLGFLFLARFFQFGSVFVRFSSGFFPVFFGLGSVRFFSFRLIKPKPNQTSRCF